MKVSTRGRYALRVLVDLADSYNKDFVSLKDIAIKEDISLKYVEAIVASLSKSGLLISKLGKDGGYSLAREPKDIKVSEVLTITEGDLSPVACLTCDNKCERNSFCKTLPMWEGLNKLIKDYLDSVSVAELNKNSERFINGSGI